MIILVFELIITMAGGFDVKAFMEKMKHLTTVPAGPPAEVPAEVPASTVKCSSRGGFSNIASLSTMQTVVTPKPVPRVDHTSELAVGMVTLGLGLAGAIEEFHGGMGGVREGMVGVQDSVAGVHTAVAAQKADVDKRFGAMDARMADMDARVAAAAKSAPLPRAKPASRPPFNPADHPCHPDMCQGSACLFNHTGSDAERRSQYDQAGAEAEAEEKSKQRKATPEEIAQAARGIAAVRAKARAQRGNGGK